MKKFVFTFSLLLFAVIVNAQIVVQNDLTINTKPIVALSPLQANTAYAKSLPFATISLSSSADEITPVNLTPGEYSDVYIYLTNASTYCALETNLFLPQGVSITNAKQSTLTDKYVSGGKCIYEIGYADKGDAGWKVLIYDRYGSGLTKFGIDDGAVAKLTLYADKTYKGGTAYIVGTIITDPKTVLEDAEIYFGNTNDVSATSISLNNSSISLVEGTTATLTATVLPSNATNKTVSWKSSDSNVATVSEGIVTAVGKGTATITATTTDGTNLSATCTVTVSDGADMADTDISKYSNIIYTTNETVRTGAAFPMNIKMKNAENIIGFQFDLKLPKGMSIVYDTEIEYYDINLSTERTTLKRHSLSYLPQENGAMRIVCTSGTNQTFSGNDGDIVTIIVNVDKDMEPGEHPVIISNIEMTTSELKSVNIDNCKSTLTVKAYTLGDVNDDGKITVTDAACVVAFILGSNTEDLIREAADVNQDGKISVTDAACVVDMILNEGVLPAKEFDFANTSDGMVGFNSDAAVRGNFAELDVNLKSNYREFTGMQFDIVLPEGMKIAKTIDGTPNVELIGDTKSHNISAVENGDRSVRVVCFSSKNDTFEGNGEAVVRLRVAANNMNGMAEVGLRNIELVRPNLTYSNIEDQSTFVNFADVTGITSVNKAITTDGNVYNLNGMHVDENYKGIIVFKGKKIIK